MPLVSAGWLQAFINTAREIYKKIQDGVFDVSNEVRVCVCVCWAAVGTQAVFAGWQQSCVTASLSVAQSTGWTQLLKAQHSGTMAQSSSCCHRHHCVPQLLRWRTANRPYSVQNDPDVHRLVAPPSMLTLCCVWLFCAVPALVCVLPCSPMASRSAMEQAAPARKQSSQANQSSAKPAVAADCGGNQSLVSAMLELFTSRSSALPAG